MACESASVSCGAACGQASGAAVPSQSRLGISADGACRTSWKPLFVWGPRDSVRSGRRRATHKHRIRSRFSFSFKNKYLPLARMIAISSTAESVSRPPRLLPHGAFQLLARSVWRRCKGGYVRRPVRRLLIAMYRLPGSPVVANTCCSGALMSAASSSVSSVPLPP